jgi:hypothetical protein
MKVCTVLERRNRMSQSKSESASPNPVMLTNPPYAEIPPGDSSGDLLDNAQTDNAQRRPIQCACGKRLLIRVAREGVILRCPEHGIQFRYEVDPRLIKAGRK